MYECPNCAGNLKFDIVRQQLYCEYCSFQMDPYDFEQEKDVQETQSPSGMYEVTVFTCPQCGGEIISEDTTAATFCSFCGGSAILDSRIRKERRPAYIIPFTKTKEDCRAAYEKMLRRALFAPKELRDKALIEKFRGIYMPYWVYSFEKKESITFPGKKTYRKGNYQITDHYSLDCDVEEVYQGLAYDASSTFSDNLSNAIAPFDLKKGKAFVPSFLSGFYADTSDVEKYTYLPEAEELVIRDAGRHLWKNPVCREHNAGRGEQWHAFRNALRPSDKTVSLAMFPVWFLSCRNGDRISYAVVNGQTGKAAADLPVDKKRYLAGSILLAVPLFFLFNLFLTVTPGKLLWMAILSAILCILISNRQLTCSLARESGEDDKGLASVRPASGTDGFGQKKRRYIPKPDMGYVWIVVVIVFLFYSSALLPGFFLNMLEKMGSTGRLSFLRIGIVLFLGIQWIFSALYNRYKEHRELESEKKPFGGGHFREKWPVLGKPLGGIIGAGVILLVKPVSDWIYYLGAFACMGTVLWAIMDIIKQHNLLATRKLPQLGRRGGDEVE